MKDTASSARRQNLKRLLKPRHIALQTQLGDFDQKTMLKQIELWGDTIIPAIKKALGTDAVQAAE